MANRFYSYMLRAFCHWFYDYLGGRHLKVEVPDPVEPKMGKPQNNVVPNVKRFSLNRGRHWDRKRH